MSTISRAEFRTLLVSLKGARILTVGVESVPRWKGGKSSPMANVKKVSRLNVMVNISYANAKAKAEGVDVSELEIGERPWGKHIFTMGASGNKRMTPFVFHGETFKSTGERDMLTVDEMNAIPDAEVYVEIRAMKSFGHTYVGTDGRVYTDAEVADWLPPSRESDEYAPRDYKLNNFVSLTVGGETYAIEGKTAAQSQNEMSIAHLAALGESIDTILA